MDVAKRNGWEGKIFQPEIIFRIGQKKFVMNNQEVLTVKKKIALFLTLALAASSAACGKKEPPTGEGSPAQQEMQTDIRLEQCGLAYSIPENWTAMEDANLIPASFVDVEGDIYAKIQYNFVPNENMAALDDLNSDVPVEELMTPIAAFLVVREDKLEAEAVQGELALYHSQEELPEQKGFRFYFLTDYVSGIGHFSDDAQKTYRALAEELPALKESAETFPPDVSAAEAAAAENDQYLNFISTNLEGEAVTSAVFYDYDLTVVNFWASYCYPDINELGTLEAFYQDLRKKYPNVNFMQVVIDTPNEEAERVAAAAYAEAGVTFGSVLPDQNMAGWIINNLNGLPTTVFVDRTGKAFSLKIEGMQDAEYYMETTETMLESVRTE